METPVTIFFGDAGYTVPDGKRLVIRYVTGQSTSNGIVITNELHGIGFFPQNYLPSVEVWSESDDQVYYTSQVVTIFATAGDHLTAIGGVYPSVWASGYLIDL